MATAKKVAPKAATTIKKVTAPAKAPKPAAKAPASKTAMAIAKLTERKNKIAAEISTLRDQRSALKVASADAAPATPKAKAAPKAAAPVKKAKPAAKK